MWMGMAPSYVFPCTLSDSCPEVAATVAKCGRFSKQFSGVRLAGLNGSTEVTVVGVVNVNIISVTQAETCTHIYVTGPEKTSLIYT